MSKLPLMEEGRWQASLLLIWIGTPCRGCIPIGCEVHKHLLGQGHEVKIKVHPSLKMHICEVANNSNNNNICSILLLTFLDFFENAPILTLWWFYAYKNAYW